jgi:hypothetical protein
MRRKEYKTKYFFTVGIFLFVVFIAYLGPVSKTIELKTRKDKMQEELLKLGKAPERISAVKKQLNKLDEVIGFTDTVIFNQSVLFMKISGYAAKCQVSIREIPQRHLYAENDLIIETNIFKFEGNYIDLVKLLNDIEGSLNNFSVVSVDFYRIKDRKTKRYKLLADFFIQGIRKL